MNMNWEYNPRTVRLVLQSNNFLIAQDDLVLSGSQPEQVLRWMLLRYFQFADGAQSIPWEREVRQLLMSREARSDRRIMYTRWMWLIWGSLISAFSGGFQSAELWYRHLVSCCLFFSPSPPPQQLTLQLDLIIFSSYWMCPLPQLLLMEKCSSWGERCTVSSANHSAVIHTSSAWVRAGISSEYALLWFNPPLAPPEFHLSLSF